MKTRQYIFRTLMLMLLALVAVSANAASLTHELGDNVTVTWYTNQDKTGQISTVTMSAGVQTIYVDIQPASGFWTDIDYLLGVEKIGSAANAGSRRTRTVPSYGGLGAIAKINTLNYGPDGAGVYQVTVPALAAGQTDSQIAEICLKGTIFESTNLSTATITATSATYSGVAQTASTISVVLGTTDLTAGTDYTITTNGGGTNVGKYAVGITGMGRYKGTASNATAFEITTKALTITANAQTITYGGSISSTTSDVTIDTTNGLVAGDELTSISLTKTETNYSATAYDDDITPSDAVVMRGEADVTANYNISYGKGDLTINKADLTISADNKEREVSEANPTFTVTYSGFVNGDDESMLTTAPTIGCNATASSPVGTYTITPSGAEAANYNIIYNNATLTIYRNFSFTGTNVWRTWYGSEDLTVNANHMETYVVTGVTASEVTITQTENGEIYKNTPMLLKYKINSMTPTIRADAADAELTPPEGLSSSFIGGLADLTTYIGCEVYILTGSEFVRTSVTEGNTAFDASKCFVYISGAAASRLSIGDDTTDIRVVERESTNDEWYTINGQKLGKRPIRPGVYIHNNKKVVVK